MVYHMLYTDRESTTCTKIYCIPKSIKSGDIYFLCTVYKTTGSWYRKTFFLSDIFFFLTLSNYRIN